MRPSVRARRHVLRASFRTLLTQKPKTDQYEKKGTSCTYIWLILMENVGKCTIHGSYGKAIVVKLFLQEITGCFTCVSGIKGKSQWTTYRSTTKCWTRSSAAKAKQSTHVSTWNQPG